MTRLIDTLDGEITIYKYHHYHHRLGVPLIMIPLMESIN